MRLSIAVAIACLSIAGVAAEDRATAAIKKFTNIPAEELGPALQTLAQIHDVQVVYLSEAIDKLKTSGAVGELTAEEALKRLLKGTGLTYRYLDEKTVTVQPIPTGSSISSTDSGAKRSALPNAGSQEGTQLWEQFRLAQAHQGAQGSTAGGDAQTSSIVSENSSRLEEILVTAQKREERLQDVPISIDVVGAQELQQRQVNSLDDLKFIVPGLSVQGDGQVYGYYLRGITDVIGSAPPVGVYLDEANVTAPGDGREQLNLNTYDLDRVEVLRGPQGTLYGEGSSGGTIRLITKAPDLTQFEGEVVGSALFTENGAPGQRLNLMINTPVVGDNFGLRFAGTFEHEGGWIDQPAAGQQNFNGQDLADVRTKALWVATPQLTINAMVEIHRDRTSVNSGEDSRGNFSQVFGQPATPRVQDNHDIYNLTVDYDFGFAHLLSSTSFLNVFRNTYAQGYGLYNAPGAPTLPGAPVLDVYFNPYIRKVNDLTQEIRLTSNESNALKWTVGTYYQHWNSTQYFQYYVAPPADELPTTTLYLNQFRISDEGAVFGNTSYDVTSRLTLGAGIRYSATRQHFNDYVADSAQSANFDSVDPRIYVEYRLLDSSNVYFSAAKGFRDGGFNALNQPKYRPESVITYEVGNKNYWSDSRLSVEVDLFYSDYSKFQIAGLLPYPAQQVDIISNAGNALVDGVEWTMAWTPADWRLALSGNYLHSKFYRITASQTDVLVGDPVDGVPKHQVNATIEKNFHLYDRHGYARVNFDQTGPSQQSNRNLGLGAVWRSGTVSLLGASIGLDVAHGSTLSFFGENLLNNRAFIQPDLNRAPRSRPRTLGIGIRTDF